MMHFRDGGNPSRHSPIMLKISLENLPEKKPTSHTAQPGTKQMNLKSICIPQFFLKSLPIWRHLLSCPVKIHTATVKNMSKPGIASCLISS